MLKFWSLLYRVTGYMAPAAKLAEYKHIRKVIKNINCYYEPGITIDDYIAIHIGIWQAKHGFYREFRFKK